MKSQAGLMRPVLAEAIGTGFLVMTVIGSGIMATRLTSDVGLQLLANSLVTGAMLIVLISLFGPLSGAHFNPMVSLVFAVRGEITPVRAVLHAVAQVVGGVCGAIVANLMFALPPLAIASHVRTGSDLWLAEIIASLGLVATIIGGLRSRPDAVPVLVGLYITAAYWFTSSTSFANPAVTLARMLSDSFAGIAPASVPAFVLMQCIGGLAGLVVFSWLFAPDPASQQERPR